ncbi:ABC transporter ATP-binding protein [Leucobacter sp. HY1908]
MSKSEPAQNDPINPSRRDRLKPLELVGFSGVLAVFAGLVVLLTTRDIVLALIFLGIAFIVVVMVVALVGLGGKPSAEDEEARKDLQSPDEVWH